MRIRRIQAEDMATALARVRQEMGPEAVIISTRTLGAGGDGHSRSNRGIEVVAGIDDRPGKTAVREALAVAAIHTVAPGAARAAYALGMAAAASAPPAPDQLPPNEQAGVWATPAVAAALRAESRPLSDPTATERFAARDRRARANNGGRPDDAAPSVSVPAFPRVDREPEDAELDALPSFREALAAARTRTAAEPARRSDSHRPAPLVAQADPEIGSMQPAPAPSRQDGAASLSGGQRWTATAVSQPSRVVEYVPAMSPLVVVEPTAADAGFTADDRPPQVAQAPEERRATAIHAAADHAFELLREAGLSDELASVALEEAIRLAPRTALRRSEQLVELALARLAHELPAAIACDPETLAGQTLCFVGAAGAGKTTALLKVAVELRRAGASVAIVAADQSRLGAREQLQRYGEVLDLPVRPAYTPDDLVEALATTPPDWITLVDTAACGPRPDPHLDEVTALLAAVPEALVILTAPAGSGEGELRRLATLAAAVGATAVVITKMDEALVPGVALNTLGRLSLPLLVCLAGRDVLARPFAADLGELAAAARLSLPPLAELA